MLYSMTNVPPRARSLRLALLALLAAVGCTQAPVQQPDPAPAAIPANGALATPLAPRAPQTAPLHAAAAPDPEGDLHTYAMAVGRAIRTRLVVPSNIPESASATYELTLASTGAIARLRPVKRSGFPAYDRAIQSAIKRAQPFAALPATEPTKPTRMQLTFKVKE
jgi:TonB family protein